MVEQSSCLHNKEELLDLFTFRRLPMQRQSKKQHVACGRWGENRDTMGPVSFLLNLKIMHSQKIARLLSKANGIHCEIATANRYVQGSNSSGLRIKRPLQGDTCRAGLLLEYWEKTELQQKHGCVFARVCQYIYREIKKAAELQWNPTMVKVKFH